MPVAFAHTQFLDPETLRSLEDIELVARLLVEGMYASRHRCPFYGHTVEFKDYREYVAGDDPRMIDWKILARTERYCVKRFEMESNMNVLSVLDVSASMGYRPRDARRLSKFEYATRLVAALSYVACRQQDSAGLVTAGVDVEEFIPARQGKRHLYGLLARLANATPHGETDLGQVLRKIGLRLKRRSMVVLVSDCLGDEKNLVDGLKQLAAMGHELIVLHILDSDEVEFPFRSLTSFRDLELGTQIMCDPVRQQRLYLARLAAFRNAIRDGSLACGTDYRFFDTSQPLELALREYLVCRRQKA